MLHIIIFNNLSSYKLYQIITNKVNQRYSMLITKSFICTEKIHKLAKSLKLNIDA